MKTYLINGFPSKMLQWVTEIFYELLFMEKIIFFGTDW